MGQEQQDPRQHSSTLQAEVSARAQVPTRADSRWDIDIFGEDEEQGAEHKVW